VGERKKKGEKTKIKEKKERNILRQCYNGPARLLKKKQIS